MDDSGEHSVSVFCEADSLRFCFTRVRDPSFRFERSTFDPKRCHMNRRAFFRFAAVAPLAVLCTGNKAMAPGRLHYGGIVCGEVPIIAHCGDGIITPKQMTSMVEMRMNLDLRCEEDSERIRDIVQKASQKAVQAAHRKVTTSI